MARSSNLSLEARLAALNVALDGAREAEDEALAGTLRAALADRAGVVVARAAAFIAGRERRGFERELEAAFFRLMREGDRTDKGCVGKLAVAEALYHLEHPASEVFRAGVRLVQMEPVWGGRIDTAGNVRGVCVLALARQSDPETYFHLVTLLLDPVPEARRLAVQAGRWLETETAELLLRFKVLAGDAEAAVLTDALAALMAIAPAHSLDFVSAFLEDPRPAVREAAAMALGESRQQAAFERLRECWERHVDTPARRTLLLPLALCRLDESFAFLLQVLEESHLGLAEGAAAALRLHAGDPTREPAIRATLKRRADPGLIRVFEREDDPAPEP